MRHRRSDRLLRDAWKLPLAELVAMAVQPTEMVLQPAVSAHQFKL